VIVFKIFNGLVATYKIKHGLVATYKICHGLVAAYKICYGLWLPTRYIMALWLPTRYIIVFRKKKLKIPSLVIRSRKSKDKQYNGQTNKNTDNGRQNTKLKTNDF
jgi:hypothetical protein